MHHCSTTHADFVRLRTVHHLNSGFNLMTFDFQSHVQSLSVFENYLASELVIAAVKKNSTVFTAMTNVVKATPISSDTKMYKILKLAGSEVDIKKLLFCPAERYLAVVGEKSVVIVDTSEVKFSDDSSALVEPFSFELGSFKQQIKCVQWHPASARKSEIVVLTTTQLLVYDILCSFSAPVLALDLSEFAELADKKAWSIAFGSSHNLCGSITLYLSTACGDIFAIYPFLPEGSHFKASTRQISQLYHECEEALESVLNNFPPVVTNSDPRVMALGKQLSLVESMQSSLAVAVSRELEIPGEVILTYSGADFPYRLQSVAKTGPNPTLVQISSNDEFSLLASISVNSGRTTVEYHGQFLPLIMGWEDKAPTLEKPTKPVAASAKPKIEKYSKPARGFGYVIESDLEEDENNPLEQEMAAYNAKLDIYNFQTKLNSYCTEAFGGLTKMAVDFLNGEAAAVQATKCRKLLIAASGTLYYCDLQSVADTLSLTTASEVIPAYDKFTISPQTTAVAYCEDVVNHSGTYCISCSATEKVVITKLVDNEVKPKPSAPIPATILPPATTSYAPAEELLVGLNRNIAVPAIKNFDPKSAESLRDVHDTTKGVAGHISSLTKFVVSLQMKLKFQMEDLNAQVLDFKKASPDAAKALDTQAQEKLARLIKRQEDLSQKQKRIQQRVLLRFEQLKLKADLPLSQAELDWYKELNLLNKSLNYGDEDEKSVAALVDEISQQIAQLSTYDHEGSGLAQKMIDLGPELSRVRHFLVTETAVIARTKAKAQEMVAAARLT